ncbi:hypothetical protein N0V88_004636 [Collariella sp. IMI 366227]|nr:hypothetical protein N0V88_004636 [Collariella sp. IMI 366227]
MGTINSGGKVTISPASSIHEDEDEDDEDALSLFPARPLSEDIPYLPPIHWRGSRDHQELVDARAKELELGHGHSVLSSYGPAPVLATPPLRLRLRSARSGQGYVGLVAGCATGSGMWLAEILCALLSIVCLAVIIGVLKTYDGRSLTDWPLSVSLNTLLAFLTAICQVSLAVPLSEGLSQLKWNSFARGERPLADFQVFEDAARGPVGSAVLLCKRKGRALGMSAATVLLTGFLLSPLTQGAITYSTRSFEAGSGTAAVPKSEHYTHPAPYNNLDPREKQAIQSGIYQAVNTELPHLQPVCSSGDCQWRNFSSLAVCAAVADVSDRLNISNQDQGGNFGVSLGAANKQPARAATLPNGVFLVGSTTACNLNISSPHIQASTDSGDSDTDGQESFLPARTSLAFSAQDGRVLSAIANFFLVYTNQTAKLESDEQKGAFRAAEVLLHFCVNTYQMSTSGGVSTSKVIHTSTLTAQDEASSSNMAVNGRSPARRGVVLRSTSGEDVYAVKREDVRLLNGYLLDAFFGTYSHRYGKVIGGETAVSEVLGTAMFRGKLGSEQMRMLVRNWTTNVATSMTNAQVDFLLLTIFMPNLVSSPHPVALSFSIRAMSSSTETGIVLATESYVHIQWAWLIFLAIQVVLTAGVLLGIMVQTAVWDVKVLKGSSTAALFAISANDKGHLENGESVFLRDSQDNDKGRISRKLRAITARFEPGERGWTLGLGRREDA